MFQSWLPQAEFLRIADFQEFQTLCGHRALAIKLGTKGGVKKEHFEQFFVGSWPSIDPPPTPQYFVAALPSSSSKPRASAVFSKMMAKAKKKVVVAAKAKAKAVVAPQPKGVKRSREHIEVAAPELAPKLPETRTRYILGTPQGDRMAEALKLAKAGCKYTRAAEIKGVDRFALSRIHRSEQELFSAPGAELSIHPQLESDLEEFIVFIFNAGHGIDWGKRPISSHLTSSFL